MVKKVKLEYYNKKDRLVLNLNKKSTTEEDKWKELLCSMIKAESYVGAIILLQEKLREQTRVKVIIEDKRTEGIN